jgi:hypothetical protein
MYLARDNEKFDIKRFYCMVYLLIYNILSLLILFIGLVFDSHKHWFIKLTKFNVIME